MQINNHSKTVFVYTRINPVKFKQRNIAKALLTDFLNECQKIIYQKFINKIH